MLTKHCPNCNSEIKVNSDHSILAICPHCNKCVRPIESIIKTTQSPFVRCSEWKTCDIDKCSHRTFHEKFDECEIECRDNRDGTGKLISNESCR